MEQIYGNCCGVDVHKKLIVACFKHGRKQEIREFGATTRELLEMAGWLTEGGCEKVAMEKHRVILEATVQRFGSLRTQCDGRKCPAYESGPWP